mmetsp:Transcript_37629/g.117267  ORF Transcript_37629/g.117267 Transcript_37629/m.117267 type:complete len:217 (+) Transcript_37629:324-974(+)
MLTIDRKPSAIIGWVGSPGIVPRLSFFETVIKTGTLFQRPCGIRSWTSPGRMSPSTTVCHPRFVASSSGFLPIAKLIALKKARNHFGLPMPRERSSGVQSAFQRSSAGSFLKHSKESAMEARQQPNFMTMALVRASLALPDQTSAGGEWKMARLKSPAELGDTRCTMMFPAPSLWPMRVTWLGSPPKALMWSWTHRSAICWSCMPKLFGTLSPFSE